MISSDTIHRSKRLLFVVSAPSGSGKTSLCNEVIGRLPNLSFSISHTTRPPRHGEDPGKDYYFVSQEVFMQYVDQDKMAEWTEIYGNYYGTAKETIQKAFDEGLDLFFDIDESGARQLSEAYPNVATVLVLPPSLDALKKRLVDRGTDDEETVRKRLKKAREEIESMAWYRYVIVNDRFEDAVSKLESIITAERCKDNYSLVRVLLNGKNCCKE